MNIIRRNTKFKLFLMALEIHSANRNIFLFPRFVGKQFQLLTEQSMEFTNHLKVFVYRISPSQSCKLKSHV